MLKPPYIRWVFLLSQICVMLWNGGENASIIIFFRHGTLHANKYDSVTWEAMFIRVLSSGISSMSCLTSELYTNGTLYCNLTTIFKWLRKRVWNRCKTISNMIDTSMQKNITGRFVTKMKIYKVQQGCVKFVPTFISFPKY